MRNPSEFLLAMLLALVLIVPLASAATGGDTAPDDKVLKLVGQGNALLGEGDYRGAIRAFEKANRVAKGTSVEAQLGSARAYLGLSDLEASLEHARAVLKVAEDPVMQAQAHNVLGLVLLETWRWSVEPITATEARKAAIEGTTPEIRFPESEAVKEAEDAFRTALDISGGRYTIVWYNLANVLHWTDRDDEALEAVHRYFELDPEGKVAGDGLAKELLECLQVVAVSRPLRFEGDVTPPVKIRAISPEYTKQAKAARFQGSVVLTGVIDTEGNVICVTVLKPLPFGLDRAAVVAAKKWKFEPATLNGESVAVHYTLSVNFRLEF